MARGTAIEIRLVILRCTKKLLAVTRPRQLADCPPDGEDWYANLLWLSGRKCLLVDPCRDAVQRLRGHVRAAGLRTRVFLVTGLIGRELRREQLPAETPATWTRPASALRRPPTAASWGA